jgi:PKHD-type hydroxylase
VASFFWVQSLVRDTARRQMLFELDQNIQALRERVGDVEAVLGLTGQYHNLVRMWSEV